MRRRQRLRCDVAAAGHLRPDGGGSHRLPFHHHLLVRACSTHWLQEICASVTLFLVIPLGWVCWYRRAHRFRGWVHVPVHPLVVVVVSFRPPRSRPAQVLDVIVCMAVAFGDICALHKHQREGALLALGIGAFGVRGVGGGRAGGRFAGGFGWCGSSLKARRLRGHFVCSGFRGCQFVRVCGSHLAVCSNDRRQQRRASSSSHC